MPTEEPGVATAPTEQTPVVPAPVAAPPAPAPIAAAPVAPATPPVAAPIVAAPKAAAPLPAEPVDGSEPNWLTQRLARERAATLKAAGFESEEAAKAAAKVISDQREAEKTVQQKLADRDAELAAAKARNASLEALNKERHGRAFSILTAAQKAAVVEIAGDDPMLQLKAITALEPTWAKEAAAAAPVAAAPVVPAATAPGREAPASGDGSQPNHVAIYQSLKTTNPIMAARYATEHAADIYKPASTT